VSYTVNSHFVAEVNFLPLYCMCQYMSENCSGLDCYMQGETVICNLNRSIQPSTLCETVKWVVTQLYGLQKVVTLVQLTGAA